MTPAQMIRFASLLLALGIAAVERHAKAKGMTTEEALNDAEQTWKSNETDAEWLLALDNREK